MAFTGLALPDIQGADLNDEKERRQILEYLYQLTDQLRYVLSNIGEENLSQELSDKISETSEKASSLTREIRDINDNISKISQTANSIELSVSNGTDSSTISLVRNGVTISSDTVRFNGDIIFASRLTDGTTQISGNNITTGTVAADRIDVDNLSVKHLSGADGTFSGTLNAAGGTFSGTLNAAGGTFTSLVGTTVINMANTMHIYPSYINANGVQIGIVPGYSQICVLPSSHESGNLGIGNMAWSQCVAQYLYSASGSVGSYSMRKLKKDITPFSLQDDSFDDIEPVYYVLKADKDQKRTIGFIADDIMHVCPELVSEFKDCSMEEPILTLDYGKVSVLLVDEVKKLRKRVKLLEERI